MKHKICRNTAQIKYYIIANTYLTLEVQNMHHISFTIITKTIDD